MGAERFLQLFDWNSKSRKKLFPSKSGSPEQYKQGKRSNRSLPSTRYDQADEVESRAGSSIKGSSEHSCASSVVDEDGYNEVRAPSVVARLMGLNSMPTSNGSEPSSTPFFDTQSLHNAHYQRENMEFERENQMHYSNGLKADSWFRSTYDSKPWKAPGRPIEKYQSEVVPPKSAKSIPITQHKLLSPIKSSGMFFTGDAAHIMEAAAKIIESGSQVIGKKKMPLVGSSSSSVLLKVKDLKEKVRATQERSEMGFSFASFRVREKEGIQAVREKISSAHSSTSSRMRDKEKSDAFQEKINMGYSSISFRMKDKDKSDAIQEKTCAAYASASFRMRDKERVDATDERLETGSSSGSFKLREKEQRDAPLKYPRPTPVSEKPFESNSSKYLKGQSMNKSWKGSRDGPPFSAPSDTKVTSALNKGKSVSLAVQAKANVQKREGVRFDSSSRQREQQPEFKSQSSYTVKNINKTSSPQNGSNVLRQNNHRQNTSTDTALLAKPSISKSTNKKALTEDSSSTRYRSSSKSRGSSRTRKSSTESTNSESEQVNSVKSLPRKKRNINDGVFEGNRTVDSGINNKSLKSEANVDRYAWIEDSRKKGMDVVSFTFTSPMTSRPTSGFNSSSQIAQITDDLFPTSRGKKLVNGSENFMSPSHGLNVIGSDALSVLLEQKLRELTTGNGPSNSVNLKSGSVPKFESNILTQDAGSTTLKLDEQDPGLPAKRLFSRFDSEFQIDPLKGVDEMDAFSSNHAEANKKLLNCQLPSPVSILEGSFSTESCNSSRTIDSGFEDSMPCSSVQACEVIGLDPPKRFRQMDADLSDSASSISLGTVTSTSLSAPKWELTYVKDILSNVDIMYENFSAGITHGLLNPQLFEDLEITKEWARNDSNSSKLERKLYFDCASESLDWRCRRYTGGGCEAWCKGMTTIVKRKERLAEELCNEISGLAGLSDCMVDELVDKDMSSQQGKWLNFESEEFSLGVEMEVQILNSLVDEIVADLLLH